jgi:hypothetical protein
MKRDRRILDETTGEWIAKMVYLTVVMFLFSWGASLIYSTHGIAYVIGIATAIIVTEQNRLHGTFKKIDESFKEDEEDEEDEDEKE